MWDKCDELCFKAKNIYNYATYIQRQRFINGEGYLKYPELSKMIKHPEPFKDLGSNSSQMILQVLCRDWKSFVQLIKKFNKNPKDVLGIPKMPKYKKKNGRHICILTNMQTHLYNGYLYFAFKELKPFNNMIKTNIKDKLLQTRIVPKGSCYVIEIVYETEVKETKEFNNRILGIDLGVDNFATLTNNIGIKPIVINGKGIKSINQYYNKQRACLQSDLKKRHNKNMSNKLYSLQMKRDNKIDYFMHCSSKSVIEFCLGNDITRIVIGLNKTWKQENKMSKKNNQNFISIPYDKFINMVKYKAENTGIEVVTTEESYTSGCSFLDNEPLNKDYYNKSRRIKRGLFKSNDGVIINADVNGSYNIIRKVFSEAFAKGIEGVYLHPIRVNPIVI